MGQRRQYQMKGMKSVMGVTLNDLEEIGAYLRGHFLLTTGRHSDQFFLLARLTEQPHRLEEWAGQLAQKLASYRTETVVGPAMGGILPGYAMARQWPGSRFIFAEKASDGTMEFRRGFRLEHGEPVVIVEDAVTTGSSVDKVVTAVQRAGGIVKALGALVDRSPGMERWAPTPFEAVVSVRDIPAWEPKDCPLCQQQIPLNWPKR